MVDVQSLPSGQLMMEYRDILLKLGADRSDERLLKLADQYEEEVNRRIAW